MFAPKLAYQFVTAVNIVRFPAQYQLWIRIMRRISRLTLQLFIVICPHFLNSKSQPWGVGGGGRSFLRYELYSNYKRVRGTRSPTPHFSRFTDEGNLILIQGGLGERSPSYRGLAMLG